MKRMYATLLMGLVLILSACGQESIEEFSHTDQRGETVSLAGLEGTPWLATFVFTNCTTVCPPMTFNMVSIQEELVDHGLEDYQIIAFSVDPAVDTPEVLEDYLANYPVPDDSKWHLLTGYSQEEISEYAIDNFKAFVKNDPNSDQVIHGTSFYLVDQRGVVVENYDGFENVPVDQIRTDLENLISGN
ncbi:MAG TPA: SCO family protein [Planococcus sp. (in: firmicutes)]|nr:SCO family protein [Planococcus sp. (in: firmicutes)]